MSDRGKNNGNDRGRTGDEAGNQDPGRDFPRNRQHGRITRAERDAARRDRPRRETTGSATGAVARPELPQKPAAARRGGQAEAGRGPAPGAATTSRYGDNGVASLGEARAHRRLRDGDVAIAAALARRDARRAFRPDPRQRARRSIKTTRPVLATRFGAGRPRFRLISTLVALLVVLGVVLGKVALMQGGNQAAALRSEGAAEWTRTRTVAAQRGAIFDRNGDELALSVPAVTVAVNPKQIVDPAGTAHVLAGILQRDEEWEANLRDKIQSGHETVGFLYVERQIDPALAEQIDALEMTGVSTYSEDRRIMPGGSTGQGVIGQTDIDGNGIAGLEAQFGPAAADVVAGENDLLIGQPGELTLEVAPGGRSIAGTEQVVQQPIDGLDLVTSLDRSVQYAVEQALVRQVNATAAQGGQVVVMLTNGDIVAMASVERENGVAVVSSGNWAAVGAYEPGSVGKIITVAAALNDGAVTPDTSFYVPWQYDCTADVTNGILSDSHYHDPMMMSVNDILVESSNVGTINVSKSISFEREYHYLTDFGLGQPSGLNFPGESAGLLKPWEQWEGTERCTIPYGQGLVSTPLQLTAAVNVIANNGIYATPRLVTATVGADGEFTEVPAGATREVVTPETAGQMQQMMENVVCDGTATEAQVDGLAVAGKTGTAYKAQADGTYFNAEGTRDYYVSFVGFFPADAPQVTILVSIDEPGHDTSGAQSAAPLFRDLVPTIRHELGIVPPPGSTDCDGN